MKKLLLLGTLLATGAIGLQEVSTGHGGTYRGPGDTVPPGGGGGGGGGGPSTPGPSGPSAPGPSGPSTPGPAAPGAPGGGGPAQPVTSGGQSGPDLTLWQFWWGFNKDPYLNLKAHIHSATTLTGSDDFFLGHGQDTQARDSLAPSPETIRNKIVPALKHALETEKHNDIVTGALIALAKIGDEPSEGGQSEFQGVIEPFLRDAQQEIAETAAVALGLLGNPASIPLLIDLAKDGPLGRGKTGNEGGVNYRTRAFATYGLGQIGNLIEDVEKRQEIVDALWELCESPRMSTRDVKVAAVIAMGLVPLPIASDAASTAGEAVAKGEEGKEKDKGPKAPTTRQEQIDYLIRFFTDEKDDNKPFLVRAHAPRAIAKLLDGVPFEERQDLIAKKVEPALMPYVNKRGNVGERELRQSASLAFGMIADLDDDKWDKEMRDALIDACGNADQQVKNFSVIALGQVGGRPGAGDNPTAGEKDVRKYLQTTLVKGKSTLRGWSALAMGVMERGLLKANLEQSQDSLQALRTQLEGSRTKTEVGAYALALGIAGDVEADKILLDKLDKMADEEARGYLAVGLGLMNSLQAIEPIQKVVAESKYQGDLLKQAAIALGLLGDKAIVTTLTTMLKDEAKTLATQAAIASALGFIGDARSVDPLVDMLADKELTGAARGFAAVALGIVADKEKLPWNAKFSVDINYRANTRTLTGDNGTGLLDIL